MITPNILLVDDETNILYALESLLSEEYNIFTATNGEDALPIMEQNNIALIIADHRMPGMTGCELLEQVRQKYPSTIRIILSANIDQNMLMDLVNTAHAHSVMAKPWKPERLKSIIEAWIKARELDVEVGQSSDIQEQLAEVRGTLSQLSSQLEQNQRLLGHYQQPWYVRLFRKSPEESTTHDQSCEPP